MRIGGLQQKKTPAAALGIRQGLLRAGQSREAWPALRRLPRSRHRASIPRWEVGARARRRRRKSSIEQPSAKTKMPTSETQTHFACPKNSPARQRNQYVAIPHSSFELIELVQHLLQAPDLRSLAKEGLSLLEIARGIQTARGCQWGAEGVSRALRKLFHGTGCSIGEACTK